MVHIVAVKIPVQEGKVQDVAKFVTDFKNVIRSEAPGNGNLVFDVSIDTEISVVHMYEEWETRETLVAYTHDERFAEVKNNIKSFLTGPPTANVYEGNAVTL